MIPPVEVLEACEVILASTDEEVLKMDWSDSGLFCVQGLLDAVAGKGYSLEYVLNFLDETEEGLVRETVQRLISLGIYKWEGK